MSLQVSQQPHIAFKKPKPGLRQVGGTVENNLKAALTDLKISTNSKTDRTSAASDTTAKTSTARNTLASTVSKNLNNSSTYNIFSDGKYDNYSSRVDGMRTTWISDYQRNNVELAFGKYSANPTKLTPRGEARENRVLKQYLDMQNRMYQKMMEQQKCMDTAQLWGNVAQGITNTSGIAIEIAKSRANQKPANETEATVNQLRQADTSSELSAGIKELNDQKQTLETSISTLTQSVSESNEIKTKNEADLKEKETTLSDKEQKLTSYNSTITKLQSSIATSESELKMLERSLNNAEDGSLAKTGLQNQYDNLKKEIENKKEELKTAEENKKQVESEVKTLKGDIETLKTTISNVNDRLADDTKKLDSSKEQLNDVKDAITKYNKKLDKKEESEGEKLGKMKSDLAQYVKDYEAETDPDKKAKLKEKFDKKAGEYNNIVSHSSVTGHEVITMTLGE